LQNPQRKNSEATRKNVTARLFPSGMTNMLFFPVDDVSEGRLPVSTGELIEVCTISAKAFTRQEEGWFPP
jgi:hypothetical protein